MIQRLKWDLCMWKFDGVCLWKFDGSTDFGFGVAECGMIYCRKWVAVEYGMIVATSRYILCSMW